MGRIDPREKDRLPLTAKIVRPFRAYYFLLVLTILRDVQLTHK